MNCKNAKILISADLDGELSERETVALDGHLMSCAACAREREKLSAVSAAMRVWEDREPSEWLAQSFAYKLRELQLEPQAVKKRWGIWQTGIAATGLLTAALAIFIVFHGHNIPVSNPGVHFTPERVAVAPAKPVPDTHTISKSGLKATISEFTNAIPNRLKVTKRIATARKRSIYVASGLRARYYRAYKPSMENRLDFHPRGAIEVASRGGSADRERVEQEQARRLIMEKILKNAKSPKGDAATVAVSNLSDAGVAMDETLERVRGALRKAADVLADVPASTEVEADSNGGKIL